MLRVAWFISAALICAGDHFGWSSRSRIAAPDTCGAAIEVPERFVPPSPVPTPADLMSKPGAEMSGLRSFVTPRRALRREVGHRVGVSRDTGEVTSLSVALTVPVLYGRRVRG